MRRLDYTKRANMLKIQHEEECDMSIQWKETPTCWEGTLAGKLTITQILLTRQATAKECTKMVLAVRAEVTPQQLKKGRTTRDSPLSKILSFIAYIEKVEKSG
eukprot:scaffold150335_cov59-Attheya_sp.AAC.1